MAVMLPRRRAFSGKDPQKVDRSAKIHGSAYCKERRGIGSVRQVSGPVGLCNRHGAPGIPGIDTFGANVDEEKLCNAVDRCFELTPLGIIDALNLRLPIYEQTPPTATSAM